MSLTLPDCWQLITWPLGLSARCHALAIMRCGNCWESRGKTQLLSQKSTAPMLWLSWLYSSAICWALLVSSLATSSKAARASAMQ